MSTVLDQFRPHVVLMDIGVPGMNGYEVVRAIRARGLVEVHVWAITGWGQVLRQGPRPCSGI
jgi:CheY-like chemotaxis protein